MIYNGQFLDLSDLLELSSFKNKAIISLETGEKVGEVDDVLIEPDAMAIQALTLVVGGFLRPDVRAIPVREVRLWGKDVVLISQNNAMIAKKEMPGLDEGLSAENLKGRSVVSLDGERNGELKDLLINLNGQIEGFEIAHPGDGLSAMIGGKKSATIRLPITTVHALGKDVIIIDLNKVQQIVPAADTADMEDTDTDTDLHDEQMRSASSEPIEDSTPAS